MTLARILMLAGFAFAAAGDFFLVARGASRSSGEFLAGVAAFCLAQIFWSAARFREARPDARVFACAFFPLALFAGIRLWGVLPLATWCATLAYSVLTALSLATAAATRRVFYFAGIALLACSDVAIGGRLLGAPGCGAVAGPLYVLAELCLLVSFFSRDERRFGSVRRNPWKGVAVFGVLAFSLFSLSMLSWPGGGYDPSMRMLSALGRTVVNGFEWPLCHFLFVAAMASAALAVWTLFDVRDRRAAAWGAALNAAGLLSIALVPENVSQTFHDASCLLAAAGAAAMLLDSRKDVPGTFVLFALSAAVLFSFAVALHALRIVPFAPWITSSQKFLIVAFSLFVAVRAWRTRTGPLGAGAKLSISAAACFVFLAVWLYWRTDPPAAPGDFACPPVAACGHPAMLSDDENSALAWLEYVTGELSPREEKQWWNIGGDQKGLFAKRYSIAFCGYAAAALGFSGDDVHRVRAGRVVRNCIERYLKRDVWAYSMSKSYWGRKPWAPDPCHRENVMYTGHLLQLLAFYEALTLDGRFWTEGFDFAWNDSRRIHYTAGRLVDATVAQMRGWTPGGVACEPGLVFFPCNNHPHFAFAVFCALGRGDWRRYARKWEKWALSHYSNPLFGGGALNLVYHAKSGIFWPRGSGGLDGWSLLWYEPWAEERWTALALWKDARARIDWHALENVCDRDWREDGSRCCDPGAVPPAAAATFLAAAARACDDPATAARLELVADRHLVRRDGMLWLDVGRDWRIGASANRIISLAEERGFRFRDLPALIASGRKR